MASKTTFLKPAVLFAALAAFCTACSTQFVDEPVCISHRGVAGEAGETCHALNTSLSDFFAAGKIRSGDIVRLKQSAYGSLKIEGMRFDEQVLLVAEPGHNAFFERVEVQQSSNLALKGLSVTSDGAVPPDTSIVQIDRGSKNIVLDGLLVQSASNVDQWTDSDWRASARNGITSRGTDVVIKNSVLRNVRHGISAIGDGSLVQDNHIVNFSGDGMRGLGSDSSFLRNSIRNCFDVDENHDDGFQSWSLGEDGKPGKGVVRNVVLRGNLILNYTDPNQPYKCSLQGIGLFDGIYEDWIIEDNTVIVDHWHGITVMGARNVRVSHNTVIDRNPLSTISPWISITQHKDGRAPVGGVVSENVMMRGIPVRKDNAGHVFDLHQPGVDVRDNLELDPSEVDLFLSSDGKVELPDFAQGKDIGARFLISATN